MSETMGRIADSLEKVRSQCGKARLLFTILFVVFCIGGAFAMVLGTINLASPGLLPFDTRINGATYVLLLVDLVSNGALFLIARSIFGTIAAGRTPFTFQHAQRLKLLGCLFVAVFVLNLLVPPAFSMMSEVEGLTLGIMSSQAASYSVISIDIKGLIGAVACFALSTVWRYGALLQAEEDGTF